jgi:hypothetical protein
LHQDQNTSHIMHRNLMLIFVLLLGGTGCFLYFQSDRVESWLSSMTPEKRTAVEKYVADVHTAEVGDFINFDGKTCVLAKRTDNGFLLEFHHSDEKVNPPYEISTLRLSAIQFAAEWKDVPSIIKKGQPGYDATAAWFYTQ